MHQGVQHGHPYGRRCRPVAPLWIIRLRGGGCNHTSCLFRAIARPHVCHFISSSRCLCLPRGFAVGEWGPGKDLPGHSGRTVGPAQLQRRRLAELGSSEVAAHYPLPVGGRRGAAHIPVATHLPREEVGRSSKNGGRSVRW